MFEKRKGAVQIILDFVEGRMPIDEFQTAFTTNDLLRRLLGCQIPIEFYKRYYKGNVAYYLDYELKQSKGKWGSVWSKNAVQHALCNWLDFKGIKYVKYPKYRDDYLIILDIQPSWIETVDDQGIFDKVLAEIPKDLSKTKQIAWGKARLKELFRYDKTYPHWVQGGEWPIVNGKPLVFSHQKKAGKDDVRTYYYFYDPDTKEETVITQMD